MKSTQTIPLHVLQKLKSVPRGLQVGGKILLYMLRSTAGGYLNHAKIDRLKFFTGNVTRSSRDVLRELNVSVDVKGLEQLQLDQKNYLFVCNHMTYLDILVASSVQPFVFVTSKDMGETFLLGRLAEMGGSVFVERRNRTNIENDLKEISETLRSGLNVMIYPEGTSTNGMQILPFKKTLLMSAVYADRDVVPVALKYLEIDGQPFNKDNADRVCWYGDMGFPESFINLVSYESLKVELQFLEPISVNELRKNLKLNAHSDSKRAGSENSAEEAALRTAIAETAWSRIQNAYFTDRPEHFAGIKRERMR